MPKFSKTSLSRLATCDARLQAVMKEAIVDCPVDFGISCGHRTKAEQDDAVARGASKAPWPRSKHNTLPSVAADILPYLNGVNIWTLLHDRKITDKQAFDACKAVWEHVKPIAAKHGLQLRWGGDWDGDGLSRYDGDKDERLVDGPHIEIRG